MRPTLIRAIGAALVAAGLAVPAAALIAAPALATGDCRTVEVTSAGAFTTSGGGTAQLVDGGGVVMSTPEQASKVSYRHRLSNPVPLSKISDLSYAAKRLPEATGHDQTVAAYKLGVDANGDGTVDGVLVYEPYYNGDDAGAYQVHNALGADGAGKWWYSAEPGNKQTLATFAKWTKGEGPVAFPAPEARWFAIEQGTWNTGAITLVDRVKFKGDGVCKIIRFDRPPVATPTTTRPTATPTVTRPTTPPTTRPTVTPTTLTPTTTPPVIGGGEGAGGDSGDSLPVTGPVTAYALVGGAAAVAVGAVLLYLSRRRRPRYVA